MEKEFKGYKNLTLDKLESILDSMVKEYDEGTKKRKFKVMTSQLGVINYLRNFYEEFFDKKDAAKKLKEAKKDLKPGLYSITEAGIEYHGKGLREQIENGK